MPLLSSMTPSPHVAIIGASGGIGHELVSLLANDRGVGRVFAFSRVPIPARLSKVEAHVIDITAEESVREAAAVASADSPLDLVIVSSGILHRAGALQPEKSMRELSPANLLESFTVNAVGPAIVAKHFLPVLRRGQKTVFAALSARVGSITDNRLGGWASYRASKAALNMLMKTLAIEQARRNPQSIVTCLHPGTVDTPLSRPYSGRVPASRLFTPTRAAGHLLEVIDDLKLDDAGGFYAWDGKAIEY
jgi:NAD(P)-dependent dehydrogenase (short-subunit alcohol dehydrogenase family)